MKDRSHPRIPDPRDATLRVRARFIAEAYAPHLRSGMKVLDIGCGNAVVSRFLVDRFGLDLHGCDVTDYRKRDIPFTRIRHDGPLPFGDGEFDVAILNDVLHHAGDQRRLLREAVRVSRLVLAYELQPGSIAAFLDRVLNFFHHRAMRVPLSFRTAEGWEALLAEEGIPARVTVVGRPRPWYPLRHILIVTAHAQTRPPHQPSDG